MKTLLFIKSKIIASSFLLLAISFLYGCEANKPEEINAISSIEDIPQLIIENLETTILDSGVIKYKIITPELYDFGKKDPPYINFPKGGQIIMYNRNGEIESSIKANYAKYLKKDKLWELRNDVEAVNKKSEVFNTEQLFLDEKKDRIYSDLHVKVTTPSQTLRGTGFESNTKMDKYSFKKPTANFEIED
ncbi:MAG: LPS export ABC transporter periplasmic protein LptC [Marinilabiliaceae bacterium]|nr:LPS export ABC transporter periplasmic protein LptC [Marinilabiliaceae bacterium]